MNNLSDKTTNYASAVNSLRLATRSASRRQSSTSGSIENEGSTIVDSGWKGRYLALIDEKIVIFYSQRDYVRTVAGGFTSLKDGTTIDLRSSVFDDSGIDENDGDEDIEKTNVNVFPDGNGSRSRTQFSSRQKQHDYKSAPISETRKPNRVYAELEPFSSFSSNRVIALTSQRSFKNGNLSYKRHTWYIEASSAKEAAHWVFLIRYIMEKSATRARLARLHAVKQTSAISKRARKQFFKLKLNLGFLRSLTRQWRFDSWGHARLAVSLRAARGVLDPHNLGVPHVYAKLCLVKTTSSSSPGAYEVVSPVLVSPVSHPPSSSPSWEDLGPSVFAAFPTFVFDKLDELAFNASKKLTVVSDLGSRVSAGLVPYALHVELWSAEQLVADESLGTALVPLSALTAVDFSDRFDKSQLCIEEEASASNDQYSAVHTWHEIESTPGKFSALIDPAVSAHAAVSLAVKLVVCRRPIFHADRGPSAATAAKTIGNTAVGTRI